MGSYIPISPQQLTQQQQQQQMQQGGMQGRPQGQGGMKEDPEVTLRRLELEQAEAQLRASMVLERRMAEVVAKKIAVARAEAERKSVGRRRS